jgi:hypothetical protein
MDSVFEVIDLRSGNVIGGYESEDDALASLRRSLHTHGQRAIEELSLMRITDDDQFLVAMQDDLERLVDKSGRSVPPLSP